MSTMRAQPVLTTTFKSLLAPLFASLFALAFFTTPAVAQLKFTMASYASGEVTSDSIVAGDFNNDGILDLVTINYNTLSFYKGLGGGKYAPAVNQSIPQTTSGGFGQVFAADFNGDGKLDLASAWGATCYLCIYGPVTILLGNGDGTFTQGTNIVVPGNATSIALADFNGDHKPDIAVSDDQANATWLYLGNGDGTFTLSDTQPYGGGAVVAGDFNGDGKQDLVYASSQNVGIFLGNGNGTLAAPVVTSIYGVTSLAVGDFYNNRIQTLAALGYVNNSTPDAYLYSIRYANGHLYVANQTLIGSFLTGGPSYLTGGDLNGDFKFDVFLAGGNPGYSAYMLGNGNGTFQSPQTVAGNSATSYQNPFIRDLNLDSRHDVAMAWFASSTAGIEALFNDNATPNCAPPQANKLSVHVCAPTSGEIVPTTFTFKCAGNAFNGIVKRMELWIDGKKVGQNLEDQLNVTTTLAGGMHKASFVVVDSFDNYTSKSITFTTN